MSTILSDMEVERVKGLVEAFGWIMTKREIGENKVIITLEKETEPLEVETDKGAS